MTTDLLITFIDPEGEERLAARSVTYRKEFEEADIKVKNRMAEKLEIEAKLQLTFGVYHLGPPFTLGFGLFGDGADYRLVEVNVLNLDVRHLDLHASV